MLIIMIIQLNNEQPMKIVTDKDIPQSKPDGFISKKKIGLTLDEPFTVGGLWVFASPVRDHTRGFVKNLATTTSHGDACISNQ